MWRNTEINIIKKNETLVVEVNGGKHNFGVLYNYAVPTVIIKRKKQNTTIHTHKHTPSHALTQHYLLIRIYQYCVFQMLRLQ